MIRVKVWKDHGYALEFEDSRIELTADGLSQLIDGLTRLENINVPDGETVNTEFCVDLEEEDEDRD